MELKDATAKKYSPCSKCMPAKASAKTTQPAGNKTISKDTKPQTQVTSDRCQFISNKGVQCLCKAKPGSKFCPHHGG